MASNDNRSVGKPGTNQGFMQARTVPVQHDKPRLNDQRKVRQHSAGDPPMGVRPSHSGKQKEPKRPTDRLAGDYIQARDVPMKSIHESELAEWNPFARLYNAPKAVSGDAIAYRRTPEGNIRLFHVRDGDIVAQTDLHDSYQSITDKIRSEKHDLKNLRAERNAMSINPHKVAKMKAYDYARQLGVRPVKVGELHREIPINEPGMSASPTASGAGVPPGSSDEWSNMRGAAASPGSPGAAPASPGGGGFPPGSSDEWSNMRGAAAKPPAAAPPKMTTTKDFERPTGRPTPNPKSTDMPGHVQTRMGTRPTWTMGKQPTAEPTAPVRPPGMASAEPSMPSHHAAPEPAPMNPEGRGHYEDLGSGGTKTSEMIALLRRAGYDDKTLSGMNEYQIGRAYHKVFHGHETPRMKKQRRAPPKKMAAENAVREGWRHPVMSGGDESRIPIRDVLAQIRALGMKGRWNNDTEEFRVSYPSGDERSAYYTTWADDAIGTAKEMAERMQQQNDKHFAAQEMPGQEMPAQGMPAHGMREGYPDTSFERDEPAHTSRVGDLSHEVYPQDPTLPDLNREFAQFRDLSIQRVHEQADREISAMLERMTKRFGVKLVCEQAKAPVGRSAPRVAEGAVVRERRRWI